MNPGAYKREREKRGTQTSVAALLGVNRVTVAKRENQACGSAV
jgi:DNA-binding protein Fis